MDSSNQAALEKRQPFSAILLPHRSLGRKGFVILMAAAAVASFAAGVLFFLIGAWPVAGFLGLDVLLIYGAFRLNYRSGRLVEKIELDDNELKLIRVHPSGRAESWSFNPYWVHLDVERRPRRTDVLSLRLHGRRIVFGSFLTQNEKRDFARVLSEALYARRGLRI